MRPISAVVTLFALAVPMSAKGEILTVSRVNQDDIVIPVFDSSLGTLNSVSLEVRLLAGVTSVAPPHSHDTADGVSTNRGSLLEILLTLPFTVTANSNNMHNHSATTPVYSGGGISLGAFSFSVATDGEHAHSLTFFPVPFEPNFGELSARMLLSIGIGSAPGDVHAYSEQSQGSMYSGAGVLPFLASNDIVIAGSPFVSNPGGNHTHTLSAFSIGSFNFDSITIPESAAHQHTIDPRFTVVATFDFTPASNEVPEPGSFALVVIGSLGLGCARWRRRTAVQAQAQPVSFAGRS